MPEPLPQTSISRGVSFAVMLGVAGSLLVALIGGSRAHLPAVALGSPVVLYVEKATTCFIAYLLFLVVVVRASVGELPSELRGVRYEARHEVDVVAKTMDETAAKERDIEHRLEYLECVVDDLRWTK